MSAQIYKKKYHLSKISTVVDKVIDLMHTVYSYCCNKNSPRSESADTPHSGIDNASASEVPDLSGFFFAQKNKQAKSFYKRIYKSSD